MNNPPTVIVDADAIIAQTIQHDKHHKSATIISNKLKSINARVIYPVTAVIESATYIQRVLNDSHRAYNVIQLATKNQFKIVEVNQHTLVDALKYFNPRSSKKNTLFDCIVAAVAEANNADAIFSFDGFYKKNGFKLASDIF